MAQPNGYPARFTKHDNSRDKDHKQCNYCGMGMRKIVKVCPFCDHNPDLKPLIDKTATRRGIRNR